MIILPTLLITNVYITMSDTSSPLLVIHISRPTVFSISDPLLQMLPFHIRAAKITVCSPPHVRICRLDNLRRWTANVTPVHFFFQRLAWLSYGAQSHDTGAEQMHALEWEWVSSALRCGQRTWTEIPLNIRPDVSDATVLFARGKSLECSWSLECLSKAAELIRTAGECRWAPVSSTVATGCSCNGLIEGIM